MGEKKFSIDVGKRFPYISVDLGKRKQHLNSSEGITKANPIYRIIAGELLSKENHSYRLAFDEVIYPSAQLQWATTMIYIHIMLILTNFGQEPWIAIKFGMNDWYMTAY